MAKQYGRQVDKRSKVRTGHCSRLQFPSCSLSKDAKAGPQGSVGADAAGVGHAKSGSMTDQLTRQHRMTLDEAHLILNTKRDAELEKVLQVSCSTLLQGLQLTVLSRTMSTSSNKIARRHRQLKVIPASHRQCARTRIICSQKYCAHANE